MRPFRSVSALVSALLWCAIAFSQTSPVRPPDVVVKPYRGKPTVFIDGTPTALTGYSTFGRAGFENDVPLFFRHDTAVYFIEPPVLNWTDDGRPAVDDRPELMTGNRISLDDMAGIVVEGDPDAWIIVRFTPRANEAWRREHPQEYFVTDDNAPTPHVPTPSLASRVFREKMAEMSAGVIRWCESRPWAGRVIGYANFHVTEGTHGPVHQGWLFDHNPLMLERYRDYLRGKYGTVERLRAAWGDPSLTFATVQVPDDKLRGPVPEVSQLDYWQGGAANAPLRDYLELQAVLWRELFLEAGAAMESALDRNALLIHDCLKQTMQGWSNWGFFKYGGVRNEFAWRLAYPEGMAASGHIGIAPLFDAPGMDGLITPHDYQARGIGGVYQPEGIVDSAVLRGKYFMAEMDTRTWLMNGNGIGRAVDMKEFAAITWRNLATGFTRGFASYWMEFGGGWLRSDEMHDLIHRQIEVVNESLEWEHGTVPGIAMIIDDACALDTNGDGSYLSEAVMGEWKMGMARCGVPHRVHLLEDLARDDFPRHRVYYFPNLFRVTGEKLALLREKVFRDGAVVVWGPGSGISDGETVGVESARRLTGFSFEMMPVNCWRRVLVTNAAHPVTAGLPADTIFGSPLSYGPILIPTDGEELGQAWTKGGHRHAGLAVKEYGRGAAGSPAGIASRGPGDYASVFAAAVPLPASLWRNLARWAGAHVWCETNDVFLADTSVVALHSAYSGTKTIRLPERKRVTDVITGKAAARSTDTITFDLDAPETRVFRVE